MISLGAGMLQLLSGTISWHTPRISKRAITPVVGACPEVGVPGRGALGDRPGQAGTRAARGKGVAGAPAAHRELAGGDVDSPKRPERSRASIRRLAAAWARARR